MESENIRSKVKLKQFEQAKSEMIRDYPIIDLKQNMKYHINEGYMKIMKKIINYFFNFLKFSLSFKNFS